MNNAFAIGSVDSERVCNYDHSAGAVIIARNASKEIQRFQIVQRFQYEQIFSIELFLPISSFQLIEIIDTYLKTITQRLT